MKALPDGTIVDRYKIIGTGTTVYRALRPSSIMGRHHNIQQVGGAWYGDVASECPPADVDALPALSRERAAAVLEWYDARRHEAYRLIVQAYPEAAGGARDMGAIRIDPTR